jgi:hypothetical protein
MNETPKCELCGEPMPKGEEMFKFHGYSGPCPKPAQPTPPAEGETAEGLSAIARGIWKVISEECFGMTPDPWVCDDESDGDGCKHPQHYCRENTARLAAYLQREIAALKEPRP